MNLNQIKLLNKEELLDRLKQNGYGELVNILQDKDVNGQTLIDLREFEIFKWRLSPPQKKILWSCIKEIKDTPSILMAPVRPKLPKPLPLTKRGPADNARPSDKGFNEKLARGTRTYSTERSIPAYKDKLTEGWKANTNAADPPNKLFKEKLQDLLSDIGPGVGGTSTLPKIKKQEKFNADDSMMSFNKPLPPLPPPSPPPRNDGVRSTDNTVRKAPIPLRKENMEPKPADQRGRNSVVKKVALPLPKKKPTESDETYLQMHAPSQSIMEDSDDYLSPVGSVRHDVDRKSPRFTKKNVLGEINPKTSNLDNDRNQFRFNTLSTVKTTVNKGHLQEFESDNADEVYELSPPFNVGTKNIPNKNITAKADAANKSEQFPTEPPENNKRKIVLKDLKDVILVDENVTGQGPIFSNLISKLNIFKPKSTPKPRYLYENVEVPAQTRKFVEMPVKNRPLPKTPSSPNKDLFSTPFPPPRNFPDLTGPDNYIELTRDFSDSKKVIIQTSNDSDEDSQIYTNTQNSEQPEEESEIYINTGIQHIEKEIQIYGNTSEIQDEEEKEDIYENTTALNKKNPTHYRIQNQTHRREETSATATKSVGDIIKLPKVYKGLNDDTTDANVGNVSTNVGNLVTLLREKLKERDLRKQVEDVVSDIDSEFEEESEDRIYGNTPNKTQSEPPLVVIEEPAANAVSLEIPISKRPLPNIPRSSSPNSLFAKDVNSTRDSDKQVKRNNSTLESPKPSTSRMYEMHTVRREDNDNQQFVDEAEAEKKTKDNIDSILNLNNEPFYRNTDRRGAKQILSKLGNGAFLFRPSLTYFLVLTVKHKNKIFNFGIERGANNMLRLNTEGNFEPPQFSTLREFVAHFTQEPITFGNEENLMEIYLRRILPTNLF